MSQTPTNKNNKKKYALPEGSQPVRLKNNKENFLIVDTSQFMNQLKTPEKTTSEIISDPPTRMLSDSGHELFHDMYGIHPVTSETYKPDIIYYKPGNEGYKPIVPKIENFVHPDKRIGDARPQRLDFSSKDDIDIGGKRRRKTKRNTKRKKTRRHRRRNTRKYK
uniref:Uncharacterized protein n=1 Tax=viral metagenome TaxID=1070528 RepID=A0A6C0DG98_9ZZZZ